jgi:hypothetical protein
VTGRINASTRPAFRDLLSITLSLSKGNRVSLLTSAHACSQACSHGQVHKYQGVRSICEVCEAIFLLF